MMVGGTQWTMDSSQFIVNVQSWVEGSIVHFCLNDFLILLVGGQRNNFHNSSTPGRE